MRGVCFLVLVGVELGIGIWSDGVGLEGPPWRPCAPSGGRRPLALLGAAAAEISANRQRDRPKSAVLWGRRQLQEPSEAASVPETRTASPVPHSAAPPVLGADASSPASLSSDADASSSTSATAPTPSAAGLAPVWASPAAKARHRSARAAAARSAVVRGSGNDGGRTPQSSRGAARRTAATSLLQNPDESGDEGGSGQPPKAPKERKGRFSRKKKEPKALEPVSQALRHGASVKHFWQMTKSALMGKGRRSKSVPPPPLPQQPTYWAPQPPPAWEAVMMRSHSAGDILDRRDSEDDRQEQGAERGDEQDSDSDGPPTWRPTPPRPSRTPFRYSSLGFLPRWESQSPIAQQHAHDSSRESQRQGAGTPSTMQPADRDRPLD